MQVFLIIAYIVVGLVQLFAIMDGVAYGLNIASFFSFFIALFVTYVPLLGSLLGVYGAVNAWDWGLWQALVLFFWYVPVALALASASAVFDRR
ncbi:hypothetical protein [Chelativorans sp. Marseille-P2723]|uniref:hypothetical protein n=1 Tax=Chelativorans sp. Marseille-P2723 TaxID=2709133 RepID=UPI00156D7140|nr:hypothetical protein [Chelativorans sp. Marseille-P2723]